jgi:hypothetical protein
MCLLTIIVEAIAVSDTLRGPTVVNIEKSSQERLSVPFRFYPLIRVQSGVSFLGTFEQLGKFFCEIHFTVLLICAHSPQASAR